MDKILITGATGFIGRHLVKALNDVGYNNTRCLVRKVSQVDGLRKYGVEIHYGDLLDSSSLEQAIKGVDTIFHLAGEIYSQSPNQLETVNINGTENLLRVLINHKLKRLIYLSSIAATGPMINKNVLLNEDTPYNPINAYGISKYRAEKIVIHYYKNYNIPAIIFRLPVVYGPWIDESSRVFLFLNMIKNNIYRIIGSGENIMSLCYIDNLIHGLLLATKQINCIGKVFLIADKIPYTVNEIVQSIARQEGTSIPKLHVPIPLAYLIAIIQKKLANTFHYKPLLSKNLVKEATSYWGCDISRAQKELMYEPQVSFQDGLKATIAWYMQNYS